MPVLTGSHIGAGQAWKGRIFCSRHTAALVLHSLGCADRHVELERLERFRIWDGDVILAMVRASAGFPHDSYALVPPLYLGLIKSWTLVFLSSYNSQ